MFQTKHDPVTRGIFVQRNVEYKDARVRRRLPFCVTFPRLANIGGTDNEALFPTDDFPTFETARRFAEQIKGVDSRLKKCPIYLLDQRWVGSSTRRELQRIG